MRKIVWVAALSMAICSCNKHKKEVDSMPDSGGAAPRAVSFVVDDEVEGLRMRLREVGPPTSEASEVTVATGEPLTDARTEALLSRVDALSADAGDRKAFAMRKGSQPPPLTGEDVQVPFPPPTSPEGPEIAEPGALEVLRFAPEGEVPLAPHLSVTFSAPMIAVTSQEEASKTVPVAVTPEPPGDWRWLGTRTLLFQPMGRFPMATDYEVVVPAGTRSANGDTLGDAASFSFSTPPLGLVHRYPESGPHGLEPVILLGFDQRVDAEALLPHVELKAGSRQVPLRQATDEEIADDESARYYTESVLQDGYWVALRAKEVLPRATTCTVTVSKGAPSAEGPRTTPGDQLFTFRTFDPLAVEQYHCSWYDDCPPTAPWYIDMNNALAEAAFDAAAIQVEPSVPGLQIQQYGDSITIDGIKQGRTTYTVTLPSSLTDVFGQTLGKAKELTFQVGPAERTLYGPGKDLVSLDPSGAPAFPVFTTNHEKLRVRIHRVAPEQWGEWCQWRRTYNYDTDTPGPLPGEELLDGKIKLQSEPDRLTESSIDLTPHLADGYGHFLLWIEPTKQPKERWRRQEILAWVQVTDLGLTAFADHEELVAWVTQLADGAPVEGAELWVIPHKAKRGASDATGLARIELRDDPAGPQVLLARKGSDAAILPQSSSWWSDHAGWRKVVQNDQLRWYTFDDRGLYRPGEEVRVKGWIRRFEPGKGGDIGGIEHSDGVIDWRLRGPRGNDLADGEARLSALGGFDVALDLPEDVNLGTAWLNLEARGVGSLSSTAHNHPIQVQEFRRPEFEVTSSAEPGPFVLGHEAIVSVEAAYYAGGGLPNAPVHWSVYASPTGYRPPNQTDYQFGPWSPWWWRGGYDGGSGSSEYLEGKTDALGQHHLGIHFESMRPPRPMSVQAEATVTDVNRQAWTSTSTVLVHPADLYVGLRTERTYVGKDEPLEVEALVVDIEGNVVTDVTVALRMARLDWSYKGGQWQELEVDPQECSLVSAEEAQTCEFQPPMGGSYRVRATIHDSEGRENRTDLRLWVAGGERPPARSVEMEEVTLVPEEEEVLPGGVARMLVQAPFFPAEGVLSVRRSGLVSTERFRMTEATTVLEVPILEEYVPDVTVQVDLVGSAMRTDDQGEPREDLPRRVAFASGNLTFKVPPLARTLQVTAAPREPALEPGSETTIDVSVRDADGKPVAGAEVAVVVADESVLALTGYQLPDPIALFYASRGPGVSDRHHRHQVVLSDPQSMQAMGADGAPPEGMAVAQTAVPLTRGRSGGAMPPPAPMSGAVDMSMMEVAASEDEAESTGEYRSEGKMAKKTESSEPSIAVRTDFRALALFAPEVATGADGEAEVALTLPDSLTRYRVMVVAVAGGTQFGTGESTVTARLPLMVRPSPPRFLNFGDRFELSVVLQNQTAKEMDVELAVRASNVSVANRAEDAIGADNPVTQAGRKVTVPANDRVEVRFPAAAQMAGTARFQAVAATRASSDASTFDLPVWTPATTEAFATYGVIDAGHMVQPVRAPGDVWPQFGGLEITTSSTQLQALTDAVLYLTSYPFDCNEQIASRVLAIAALRDVLSAFEAEGLPGPESLEASVSSDLERLSIRQNNDGGFGFWRKGDESWPYLSVHVAHAMARAHEKGYEAPQPMWNRSQRYLRNVESHIPSWYSRESKWAIRAYALNVRLRMDDVDVRKAKALLKEAGLEDLPIEAQGWVLPVLQAAGAGDEADSILRHLGNRVAETAAGAHFVTGYSDGAHVLMHSDRRVDGVILESLIMVDPDNDLIVKLVRGLLDHRQRGRWLNTQENCFVLLALDRYFHVFESETPDFVARAWLGEGYAGDHTFQGRTTERAHIDIPMGYLTDVEGDQPLVLAKDGDAGRMYYRIGMRYAPRDLQLEPADYGFAVERVYEAVDEASDVERDPEGVWHIRAGARVRVRLTMVAPMRRYHVALVDPLPAGLEPVNPELAVSGTLPPDTAEADSRSGRYWWWWRPWYEHENLRDERVEAFTSLLWDGVHTYTYVARATTPGDFVVPPTRAEEMYHPETFGRTGSDRVIVE